MKVVVTGATGFIGSAFCQWLVATGHTVWALTRNRDPVAGVQAVRFTGFQDRAALDTAVDGADTVVHLAARVHVMRNGPLDDLDAHRELNALGTVALLNACHRRGVRHFVYVSSVKAVGVETNDAGWDEHTLPQPQDSYGISKREAEIAIMGFAGPTLRPLILRLPMVYGPGMRGNMLQLFHAVNRGFPFPLAAIRNRRSVVYVGNVVAALGAAVELRAHAPLPLFIADHGPVSTPELVRLIASALGKHVLLVPVPPNVLRVAARTAARIAPTRAGALPEAVGRLTSSLVVNPSAANRLLGLELPFSTQAGIEATAHWFRFLRDDSLTELRAPHAGIRQRIVDQMPDQR